MYLECWKVFYDFKIKRKSDVEKFVDEVLCKGNDYFVQVNGEKYIKIIKDNEGKIEVGIKQGNLMDWFNPILVVTGQDAFNEIWKCRKAVNAKFFNHEE